MSRRHKGLSGPRSWVVQACAAASALGLTGPLQAAMVTYLLDQTNGEPGLADGTPFASVRIDDDLPGAITFTVQVLPALSPIPAGNFGIQQFGFNVIGANPLSDASGSNAQWSLPAGWSANLPPPNNQFDGFGRFDVSVSTTGSARAQPLVFRLLSTGLTLGSFAEASSGSAGQGNFWFSAHITGIDAGNGVTSAYFAGPGPAAPVPLPASGVLLAVGLLGGGMLARRRIGRD